MLLVDTSVWIEAFRNPSPFVLTDLVDIDEIVTCLPIVQEVLQGFRDDRAFRVAREAMLALPTIESPLTLEVHEEAVRLYRVARRSGITLRSGVDCLIAACALRNGIMVLHRDRDFDRLSSVSDLRQRDILKA